MTAEPTDKLIRFLFANGMLTTLIPTIYKWNRVRKLGRLNANP